MPKRFTLAEFIDRACARHPGRFDYTKTDYWQMNSHVTITCRLHGDFKATPANHLNCKTGGCRKCRYCGGPRPARRMKPSDFLERVKRIHGDAYDYSQVLYANSETKVTLVCPKHGVFRKWPQELLKGHGCPRCAYDQLSLQRRLSFWNLIDRILAVHSGKGYEYDLRGYVGVRHKLRMRCPKHGWFTQHAAHHLAGRECPKCFSSRGECRVRKVLYQLGQEFCEQVRFQQCRDQATLPFDFYIPTRRLLIEYDGKQHFYPFDRWGGEAQLQRIQRRDAIKNRFAAENGYRLIRIPYWDFNRIESILRRELGEAPDVADHTQA